MGAIPATQPAAGCGEALLRLEARRPFGYDASSSIVRSALVILEGVCANRAPFRLGVLSIVAGRRQSTFLRVVIQSDAAVSVVEAEALAKIAAEHIAHLLYRAYRVTPASRTEIRAALGAAPGLLPLAVSVFITSAAPDVWTQVAWFQPIIDCQLEQQPPSLVAFGLASASPDPARPHVARYALSALTLGVDVGSPIHEAIADQLCGRGEGVLNPADPTDQPTLQFAPITNSALRAQILNFGAGGVNTGAFGGVNPLFEARYAALLFPLPSLQGQVSD